jgi:hypothetical protein
MNTLLKPLTLVAIFFFAASLKSGQKTDASRFKSDGYFTASIDGSAFDTRSYDRYTAEVTNESDYAKGEKSTDLTFYAGNHYDQNGNLFEESLQFKYALTASTIGDALGQKIVFQYNQQKFISIPGQTKIKITQVRYSTDHSSMYVSATFDGKMTQWAAPGQPQAIIHVKGRMENINVSLPAGTLPSASL